MSIQEEYQGEKLHSINMSYNEEEKSIDATKNIVLYTISVPFEEVVEIDAQDFSEENLNQDINDKLEKIKKNRLPREGEEVIDRN